METNESSIMVYPQKRVGHNKHTSKVKLVYVNRGVFHKTAAERALLKELKKKVAVDFSNNPRFADERIKKAEHKFRNMLYKRMKRRNWSRDQQMAHQPNRYNWRLMTDHNNIIKTLLS